MLYVDRMDEDGIRTTLTQMLSYIDPGAGSLILQALAGGVAGLVVFGRLYWGRLKRVLRFGRHDSTPGDRTS